MKTKTIIEIDYHELEKLVKEKLGYKEYDFVAVEECGNSSSHEFDVSNEFEDAEYDEQDIAKWEKGEFVHYSNGTVLNQLCRKGYIPAGEYLVNVFW